MNKFFSKLSKLSQLEACGLVLETMSTGQIALRQFVAATLESF